jgi:signal transduction histidine kinase
VAATLFAFLSQNEVDVPTIPRLLFWVALLLVAELLPVTLGFGAQMTMSLPIMLASVITFDPAVAMIIALLGTFDVREARREIPVWHSFFNRGQLMLAAGTASFIVHLAPKPFAFPEGFIAISAGTLAYLLVNLTLVTAMLNVNRSLPIASAIDMLVPRPIAGFAVMQIVLAALGAATAAVYLRIHYFVALFLIPLLFARLSILGARAQQELSERVRKQQQALLEATERVFKEREDERHRIAEEIHDGSLQLLAAASYGTSNAHEFIRADKPDKAQDALSTSREAINTAMSMLRDSLVDLRRSSVEEGGLLPTIHRFADQVSVLWGTEIKIEGTIRTEPPISVALAAFQILQEGLTNALKHAPGGEVTVRISDGDGKVHIIVEDEGPGFDPESEVSTDHVGMKLMKERAARVGGSINLDTAPGMGTRLEAILPGGVVQ